MHEWLLLRHQPDGLFEDTGRTVKADTIGRAIELLLPAAFPSSTWSALRLDIVLGETYCEEVVAHGVRYRVVALAAVGEAIARDAAEMLARFAGEVEA